MVGRTQSEFLIGDGAEYKIFPHSFFIFFSCSPSIVRRTRRRLRKLTMVSPFNPLISFCFFGGSFGPLYMMFEAFGFMQERTLRCRNLFSATFGGAALAVSTRFD
jgi:hypothetical protein